MKLKFELIDNLFTVHKFPAGHDIPKHIYEQQFYFIGKTDNELSVVCNSALVLNSETSEPGWACLRIAGKMDFSLLGVLAEVTAIIAEAEISIFVLSTFDKLVKSNPQLKRWLSKNKDIQGVVCLDGSQLYI